MYCAIMSTVSKTNMDEIPGLIDVVVEKQADVFAVGRYCPTSEEKKRGIPYGTPGIPGISGKMLGKV